MSIRWRKSRGQLRASMMVARVLGVTIFLEHDRPVPGMCRIANNYVHGGEFVSMCFRARSYDDPVISTMARELAEMIKRLGRMR
jgi:hypothetical protein